MKKNLILLLLFVIILSPSIASEQIVLNGNINFDWVTKTQLERDTNIEHIRKTLYSDNPTSKYSKKEFRNTYKDYLKDKNTKQHYIQVLSGIKETETENIAGFYALKDKILYAYAIQYKNNPMTVYYYDTLGNLRYVDKFSDNYPNYPYYSHQYYANGKLISSIYFTAYDTQYMYKNGKFIGVWFKDTMFNSKAKKIMTRTNY